MEDYIFTIATEISFALICMVMAENRGRNKIFGIAAGLMTGFLAVIYYWIVGDTKKLREEKFNEAVSKATKK